MANTDLTLIPLGDRENRQRTVLLIPAKTEAHKPGIIDLQTVSGTTVADRYLYFDSAGTTFKYHTSVPTDIDAQGTAIGAAASVTLDQAYANGARIDGAISHATAIRLGGAGSTDNIEIYHDATDAFLYAMKGDLKITAEGGDVNFDNEHLTTTGKAVVGSTALTLGATAAGAYIYSNAGVLTFYDADYASAISLKTLAGGALNNPTVTGDLTITDGKLVWTDAVNEIAGAFTFSNVANDGIDGAGRCVRKGPRLRRLVDTPRAADAATDLTQPTLAGFVGELGIGDARAHHADQVAIAVLDEVFRDDGIVDAPAEQHRDSLLLAFQVDTSRLAVLAKLRMPVVRRRHVRRRAPAVTDVDVDEIEQAGLPDVVEHLAHLEIVVAAVAELLAADANAERERVADALADAP